MRVEVRYPDAATLRHVLADLHEPWRQWKAGVVGAPMISYDGELQRLLYRARHAGRISWIA